MRWDRPLFALFPLLLAACDSASPAGPAGPREPAPSLEPLASCTYVNPFSSTPECREYLGAGWEEASMARDCRTWSGELVQGARCDAAATLGRCAIDGGEPREYAIVFPGDDASACDGTRNGCETFAGGTFAPSAVCEGGGPGPGPGGGGVFQPPVLSCVEPLEGEAVGASEGGTVCTWTAISGCTEEGRRFADYGACDTVRTQRPYYPARPAEPPVIEGDRRMEDPEYVAELEWVTEQIEACACVCCHSSELSPSGPSNWFIEAEAPWVDSMGPNGLALAAGWVDSTALGAYPPEDNNGFERSVAGIPTTDAARMVAFFEREIAYRGLTREDFAETRPFGGPLVAQLEYEPGACEDGVGVAADGTITWTGGGARYVYVLEEGSDNPLVPPTLDLPEGTVWRVDVPPDAAPIESGIRYGVLPEGTAQRFPAEGAPAALVAGRTYYLYVLADVAIPRTRCLFTAE